jgi:uncharacterized protein YjiK
MFLRTIGLFFFVTSTSLWGKSIAKIPEASGISYCPTSDTLMVANDEGSFYEISPKGEILQKQRLGDYDLEGVVCHEDRVVFAIEEGGLLVVDRATKRSKRYKLTKNGKKFKLNKKAGVEGLAFREGKYYLSIQAKKKEDAKILIVKLTKKEAKIEDIISHGIIDSAGLAFREEGLYIVSDKKDKLYLYDIDKKRILKKFKLKKFAQEGVTFDEKGSIYFADDDGAVERFKQKSILE